MSDDIAVRTAGLGKRYRMYEDPGSRLLGWMSGGRLGRYEDKWAIRDVSFEVQKGTSLGIIGANGAGKSTLLKVIAGITPPTEGTFQVRGRLGSLLELGAGFHPAFTGRANIFMNAAIMGIPKKDVEERFLELAEFADLGPYLNRQVRTYSSGMIMRLGFAVAMISQPAVLILDEILAVGDQRFQKKCQDKIRTIREAGTTILFVSHSIYHVRQICDTAIWIKDGVVQARGEPRHVTDTYVDHQLSLGSPIPSFEDDATEQMSGPHLTGVSVTRAGNDRAQDRFQTKEDVDFHLKYANPSGQGRYDVVVTVLRNDGIDVFSARSSQEGLWASGTSATLRLRIPLRLTAGEFIISSRLEDEAGETVHSRGKLGSFKVTYEGIEKGLLLPRGTWLTPEETTA